MSDYQYNPNQEQWKNIPGIIGYEVSDHGRVRSYRNNRWGICDTPRILKPTRSGPYYHVHVRGMNRSVRIHTLVLLAFGGPRPPKHECRHLDGNPLNNHRPNLKWGTSKENRADATFHGTGTFPTVKRGVQHNMVKLTESQVIEIRKLYARGSISQKYLGQLYGLSQTGIYYIVKRINWKHIP